MLANFGEMVVRQLEKERVLEIQKRQTEAITKEKANVLRAMNLISEAVMMCDISQPSWPVVFTNDTWEAQTGISCAGDGSANFWDVYQVRSDCFGHPDDLLLLQPSVPQKTP